MSTERPPTTTDPSLELRSRAAPIIERAPLPIVEVEGSEHRVTHVNSAFCGLLGRTREELVGQFFAEIVPGGRECVPLLDEIYETGKSVTHAHTDETELANWLYAMWPALDAQAQPVGVIIQLTKAASFRQNTAAINERLLIAGLHQHELTEQAQRLNAQLVTEITEREGVESALRASEQRLRFMAESMPQKIFTATPDGAMDYFNRQWTEFTGMSVEQILNLGWLHFIHPEDLEENIRQWQHSIATGEPFYLEHRFLRIDGAWRWHVTRAVPMLDPEGAVLMWIGSNTDIEEVRQAKDQAVFASHAKDDFLAALSHELRTPLTPVLMSAAALREDERLPPDVRDQLSMMERNIALEARLIDDLLDLTRIAHGKLFLRTQSCDAHNLIELAVEMVRSDAEGKGQKLEVDLAAERSHLIGDPSRLQQVFWNLLNNAVKFTPESGQLSVRSHDAGEHLALEIRDSGIGISAESIERIFLPFEQAGAVSAEHRIGGLGLGLSIVKAIVDLHGGSIRAASEGLGEGSTFSLELPATEPPPESAVGSDSPAAGDAGASPRGRAAELRLLLVEDHQSTIDVLERLLTRAGHSVTTAMSVANARKLAEAERFDAVISDLGLPDGTGYELMETLRAAHGLRGIALSGYGMDDDLRRSEEAGFSAHLTKPIDFAQLERALNELMARALIVPE